MAAETHLYICITKALRIYRDLLNINHRIVLNKNSTSTINGHHVHKQLKIKKLLIINYQLTNNIHTLVPTAFSNHISNVAKPSDWFVIVPANR